MKANASKHKAMGYDRMAKDEVRLEAEVEALIARAEAIAVARKAAAEQRSRGKRRGVAGPRRSPGAKQPRVPAQGTALAISPSTTARISGQALIRPQPLARAGVG